jgi:dTDP-4-dehydrorhamnose reductase
MIFLLGSTGYVGEAFAKFFNNNDINYTTYRIRYPFDANEFRNFLLRNKITHVFNCAGYTGKPNVDACEMQKDETLLANAILPKQIADICCKHHIEMMHVSSGCIYTDVNCDQALAPFKEYNETDAPNFCFDSDKYSWYSATKALGEQLIRDYSATVVRLRIPFNGETNMRNYIDKIIKYPVLLNATNSFSQLDEFVAAAFELRNAKGIYNLTQPGYLTTKRIIEMLQQHGIAKDKLYFRNIDNFNASVKTPRSNCVLDSSRAIRCGVKLTPIEDAMQQAIDEYIFNTKHA